MTVESDKFSSVDVIWQHASKHIKKPGIGATVNIYPSHFSVVGSEEETKDMFKFSDSSLVGCGNLSPGKRQLSTGK